MEVYGGMVTCGGMWWFGCLDMYLWICYPSFGMPCEGYVRRYGGYDGCLWYNLQGRGYVSSKRNSLTKRYSKTIYNYFLFHVPMLSIFCTRTMTFIVMRCVDLTSMIKSRRIDVMCLRQLCVVDPQKRNLKKWSSYIVIGFSSWRKTFFPTYIFGILVFVVTYPLVEKFQLFVSTGKDMCFCGKRILFLLCEYNS